MRAPEYHYPSVLKRVLEHEVPVPYFQALTLTLDFVLLKNNYDSFIF